MLPMLLVDVVKFAVGSWSGRSASCASCSILQRPAFRLYVWGGMFGVNWQVFQNNVFDPIIR